MPASAAESLIRRVADELVGPVSELIGDRRWGDEDHERFFNLCSRAASFAERHAALPREFSDDDYNVAGSVRAMHYSSFMGRDLRGSEEFVVSVAIPDAHRHAMGVLLESGRPVLLATLPMEADADALAARSRNLTAEEELADGCD